MAIVVKTGAAEDSEKVSREPAGGNSRASDAPEGRGSGLQKLAVELEAGRIGDFDGGFSFRRIEAEGNAGEIGGTHAERVAVERLGFGVYLAGAKGFEHLENLGGGGSERDAGEIGVVFFQQEPRTGASLRALGNGRRIERPLDIRRLAAFFREFADEFAILPGADPDRLDHALGEPPMVSLADEVHAGRIDTGFFSRCEDGDDLFDGSFLVFERTFRFAVAIELRESGVTILDRKRPERGAAGVSEADADGPNLLVLVRLGLDRLGLDIKGGASGRRQQQDGQQAD